MTKEQVEQGKALMHELNTVQQCAMLLRQQVNEVCQLHTAIQTAGIQSNLKALIDVWEAQQIETIDKELETL